MEAFPHGQATWPDRSQLEHHRSFLVQVFRQVLHVRVQQACVLQVSLVAGLFRQ